MRLRLQFAKRRVTTQPLIQIEMNVSGSLSPTRSLLAALSERSTTSNMGTNRFPIGIQHLLGRPQISLA